jgi:hypothetical protein
MKNKNSLLVIALVGVFIVLACKHEKPYPPISNTPIRSFNCSSDTVYFQNTILPILASNCGMSGCHNEQSHREGVVVTDYVSLMNSDIIDRGHGSRSELYGVITDSGEDIMPPSNMTPLTGDQINSIKKWIDQGAINNQCMECDTSVYTFSEAVLPLVQAYCKGCHNVGSADGEYFDYNSITADTALVWSNISDGSMPKLTTLSDCQKEVIKKWLDAGAPNN